MKPSDLVLIADVVGPIVKGAVAALQAENSALATRVAELEARPAPPVPEVERGPAGNDGRDGKDGADGRDGASAAEVVEALSPAVDLAIERALQGLRDRAAEQIAKAVAEIPPPRDGVDGLPALPTSIELAEDGQTIVFTFADDTHTKSLELRTAIPVDAGVYSRAATYRKGQCVTQDGGVFIAKRDEPGACPGDGWRLAVRRGREGDPGKPGEPGKNGRDGRDLTKLGPDGAVYA